MNIEVYMMPGCVQCEYTEKKLSEFGVPHNTIDVTQSATAMDHVLATGNLQMPLVEAGDDSWNGFQYDKLQGLRVSQPGHAYGL
jgi:glutaredoxin-like protein NrdH